MLFRKTLCFSDAIIDVYFVLPSHFTFSPFVTVVPRAPEDEVYGFDNVLRWTVLLAKRYNAVVVMNDSLPSYEKDLNRVRPVDPVAWDLVKKHWNKIQVSPHALFSSFANRSRFPFLAMISSRPFAWRKL
jgi:hypothetical protein